MAGLNDRIMSWLADKMSLFGKNLPMSTTNWTSGTCTIQGVSKYSIFQISVGSNANACIGVRDFGANYVRFFMITGGSAQYIINGYFTIGNNDVCTYNSGYQLTHNGTSGHSGGSSSQKISKVVGLVPILGGGVVNSLSRLLERRWRHDWATGSRAALPCRAYELSDCRSNWLAGNCCRERNEDNRCSVTDKRNGDSNSRLVFPRRSWLFDLRTEAHDFWCSDFSEEFAELATKRHDYGEIPCSRLSAPERGCAA